MMIGRIRQRTEFIGERTTAPAVRGIRFVLPLRGCWTKAGVQRRLPPLSTSADILAWVALWRPGELLLYEWYPYRRDARLFGKLARATVRVEVTVGPHRADRGEIG